MFKENVKGFYSLDNSASLKCIYILTAQRTHHGQVCASHNSQNIFISIILAEPHKIHATGKASI